jgi:YHS domain-containing protein
MAMNSLIYFLIWGGLFFLMMRFGCGAHVMGHGHGHSGSRSDEHDTSANAGQLPAPPEKAVDPVCHMDLETAKAKSAIFNGRVYYFCSQDCRAKFEADPRTYVIAASDAPAAKEHHHAY